MEPKPAVLAMRAISTPGTRRTVIDATTSPRASLSLTLLRTTSRTCIRFHPVRKRQRQADDHQRDEYEIYKNPGCCSAMDNGHELKNQLPAQVFQQEQRKHEGNHASISNQHQYTEQADDELRESPDCEKRNDCLCAGGGECMQGDPVGRTRHEIAVEDGVQADAELHQYEQGKEPERELVAAIRIVDLAGKKTVEHVG